MTAAIKITGAGLAGTLRLTWAGDNLAHVIEHADTDETTGTWIGLACPGNGLTIGSDVDTSTLRHLCAKSEIAELVWEAPQDLAAEHNQAHEAALKAYYAGRVQFAEQEWNNVQTTWSRAWAANCAAIEFMQGAGLTRFSPAKPQRWVVASFEHHCGPHGVQHPHVHNIVIMNLTS
jgi:hypothetical protein